MRHLFKILAAIALTASVFFSQQASAQVPETISYQTVVKNSDNNLVRNINLVMRISILKGSSNGTPIYVEVHFPTTDNNGLVSLEIGNGTAVTGSFDTIDWANDSYFIKTETDPTGGVDYTIIGTTQLLTVPYALHAKTTDRFIVDTTKHYPGEIFGGGIVFSVYDDGKHGLIASLDDLDGGGSVDWSNIDNLEIGDSAQSMTDGMSNTIAIIGQIGHTSSAAKRCADYSNDGFSDWYLPSAKELCLLGSQDVLIDDILNNDGNPSTNGLNQEYSSPFYSGYWSSTERNNTSVWVYFYSSGTLGSKSKTSSFIDYRVRAIRAF